MARLKTLHLAVALTALVASTGILSAQPLSGTYTIGGTTPSYQTFSAAVAALTTNGISGAVIFNVRAGTYTEQIDITAITGSSASNTVTFESESGVASSVTLQFAATGSAGNYVVRLSGASHVRIMNMTVTSSGLGGSYRNALVLTGTVDDIIVQGNSFNGYTGTSSSQDLALISSPSSTILSNVKIMGNAFSGDPMGLR